LINATGNCAAKPVNFVGVLNAWCASVIVLEDGRCVDHQIIQHGLESDVFVGISLVDMYAKCGSTEMLGMCTQDAISRCGFLECHTWRMCHAWAG
jgi:hypothetical protein